MVISPPYVVGKTSLVNPEDNEELVLNLNVIKTKKQQQNIFNKMLKTMRF
jgi:hypothetical protein